MRNTSCEEVTTPLEHTHLIQEVEAASIDDVLRHVAQTLPTENVWIINKTGNTKPFVHIPMHLGPPLTPMAAPSKF